MFESARFSRMKCAFPLVDTKYQTLSCRLSFRLLFFCMAVVALASWGASWIQTSGGTVDVRSITFPTQDGQWLTADLFKPRSATQEQPAPLVVIVPGFQRSKETLSNISIELSRRGVVVIAIDPYAQGNSSSSSSRRAGWPCR